MKKCAKCNAPVLPAWKYCNRCGIAKKRASDRKRGKVIDAYPLMP